MNNKLKKILFGLGIIGIIIVISTTFLFIYTRYIQPEPTLNWLDVFRPQLQNEQPKEVTKPDIAKLQAGSCLVFEEKNCDVTVSTSSPPTIYQNKDLITFNASWNVPTGTVIFAPFAGEIVFLSVTLKEEASRDILGLLGESGESWQSFMIFAYYDFKPLVEQGQKVKAGDPLVQVVDREIKLEFASSLQSQQIDETNKWYNLLVGK